MSRVNVPAKHSNGAARTSSLVSSDYTKEPQIPGVDPWKHPHGTGFRPAFHALWHLDTLRVAEIRNSYKSEAWAEAAKFAEQNPDSPMRVVIIDTPVDFRHPSLCGAIDLGLMRDFSRAEFGSFCVRQISPVVQSGLQHVSGQDVASRAELREAVKNGPDDLSGLILEEIEWIESGLKSERPKNLRHSDEAVSFGAHGTAVAGLIGARPAEVSLRRPAVLAGGRADGGSKGDIMELLESTVQTQPLPYSGINPFCRIVPVGVSARPGPEMLQNAVNYARLIKPDVVVIADSWDRPSGDNPGRKWEDLQRDFLGLCRESVVLCAAGNEDRAELAYPAALSKDPDGPWAVGACDSATQDLSYSPDHRKAIQSGAWMIKTLSTELPLFNREELQIDPYEAVDEELGTAKGDNNRVFPPRDIVTTDVPGRSGYNPSPYRTDLAPAGEILEFASLFTRFAGTSASVALAGGLVSLIPRECLEKLDREGMDPVEVDALSKLFDYDMAKELFEER